jgi:hypothetical protein
MGLAPRALPWADIGPPRWGCGESEADLRCRPGAFPIQFAFTIASFYGAARTATTGRGFMKGSAVLKRVLIVLCVLMALLIGGVLVALSSAGSSSGGTLSTGRVVNARSHSWSLTTTFANDTATITTAGHTIVVGPIFLKVDGRVATSIKPTVMPVDVNVGDEGVTFVVDNQEEVTFLFGSEAFTTMRRRLR